MVGKAAAAGRQSLLAVDVGNGATSLGLVAQGRLAASWTLTTPERMTADEARMRIAALLSQGAGGALPDLDDAVMASVVPDLSEAWAEALRSFTGKRPLQVGPGVKTGIKMRYNDPGELGADRIANVVAAKDAYPAPFVVVDLGAAVNLEVIDREGCFVGGAIAAGMGTAAMALAQGAAQLSKVDLRSPASVLGKNTREAMRAGVVLGQAALVDGLVDLVWRELGYETLVVATGADAATMVGPSRHVELIDEHLALRGLALIHGMNRR